MEEVESSLEMTADVVSIHGIILLATHTYMPQKLWVVGGTIRVL